MTKPRRIPEREQYVLPHVCVALHTPAVSSSSDSERVFLWSWASRLENLSTRNWRVEERAEISEEQFRDKRELYAAHPLVDKCAFSGVRADVRAGGTCAGMCLSEEKLSSGALPGEARVNKAAEFLQRKPTNGAPWTVVLMRLLGSALASSRSCATHWFSISNKTGYISVCANRVEKASRSS